MSRLESGVSRKKTYPKDEVPDHHPAKKKREDPTKNHALVSGPGTTRTNIFGNEPFVCQERGGQHPMVNDVDPWSVCDPIRPILHHIHPTSAPSILLPCQMGNTGPK